MKKILQLTAFFLLPLAAWSQADYPTTIEGLSSDDLNQLINSRLIHTDPVKARHLMTEALAAHRDDLVLVFFKDPASVDYMLNFVSQLTDASYRQRLTILMLRAPSPAFWPKEPPPIIVMGGFGMGTGAETIEPFASIPKLLPGVTNLTERLKTKAERDKLAAEMEAALNAKAIQAEKVSSSAPTPSASDASAAPERSPPAPTSEQTSSEPMLPKTETNNQNVLYLCIGAAIAAVLCVMRAGHKSHT